jgi:hypothetical protein
VFSDGTLHRRTPLDPRETLRRLSKVPCIFTHREYWYQPPHLTSPEEG